MSPFVQNCNLMEPRHPASTGPNLVAEAALAVANFASVDVPLLRGGAGRCALFVGEDIHLRHLKSHGTPQPLSIAVVCFKNTMAFPMEKSRQTTKKGGPINSDNSGTMPGRGTAKCCCNSWLATPSHLPGVGPWEVASYWDSNELNQLL